MTNKLAYLAAAASLTFAGAAFAQQAPTTTPTEPAAPATTPAQTTPPADSMTPPAPTPSADSAATPTSANVATDFKVGTEVKDPAGVVVGTISGTSAAADGSTNVVITHGAVKFALPSASLAATADGVTTTATKAQIDATLAGAKPQ